MAMKKNSFILILFITIFCSCNKDDLIWDLKKFATISTISATNISNTSVTINGEVKYDGGSTVIQRGVCWSTNQNPTIADNITSNGSGSGSFTSYITSLNANTTYYSRAYATNGVGTAYGNQINFTTPAFLVDINNCESLIGITSLYYGLNGTSHPWDLSNDGYSGACWVAPDPSFSSGLSSAAENYVQLNRNFISQGYIEFWVNAYNPGSTNQIPEISVNGSAIVNATMVAGQSSSFDWMKVRSPIMQASNNTIRIYVSGNNIQVLKVDEIEFYEY